MKILAPAPQFGVRLGDLKKGTPFQHVHHIKTPVQGGRLIYATKDATPTEQNDSHYPKIFLKITPKKGETETCWYDPYTHTEQYIKGRLNKGDTIKAGIYIKEGESALTHSVINTSIASNGHLLGVRTQNGKISGDLLSYLS